jgi:ribonuclease VapC
MSVATWLEVCIVADARSTAHGERLDRIIEALDIEIVPVSTREGQVARVAYRRYGRGSGSPAQLNFGDCFAYALSVTTGEPLLFTGDDFGHTDVAPALRATS